MKYIDQLNIAGKRVFIRADLNVPLDKNNQIADDTRIRAALPTIQHVLDGGGSVVLASHLGRPKGKRVDSLSLRPVADRLGELLKCPVYLARDCISEETKARAKKLQKGEVLLLENLRFHAGEKKNDAQFASQLAELADAYVNDAFGTAHRAHASTSAVVKLFEIRGGGFTLKNELTYFAKAFENPEKPFSVVFGGAKVSTKMAAIHNVAPRTDKLLIGGAMANTFFAAQGYNIGKSLHEAEEIESAKSCIKELKTLNCELMLPTDLVVSREFKTGAETKVVNVNGIEPDWMALDIGPATNAQFRDALLDARTIIWNGPMGAFEIPEFSNGTYQMIDSLVTSGALTVVGGGDTDLALHQRNAFEKMSYVSTGGGAFLKLLEGCTLPAVAALEQ